MDEDACRFPGKVRYLSRHEAKRRLRTWLGKEGRRTLEPYYCSCGFWHLGHRLAPRGSKYVYV